MTSIFSGQLYRNFVKDQNSFRLENYDVNRFQKTVQQQAAQGQREKTLREGLEFHQAIMADLQTKLSDVTEKLNNLYRRYLDNKVTFRKVSQEPNYYGTSYALDSLPDVNSGTNTTGYPTGPAGILPYDDYDKIRNYSYNPFFGSKAIDGSDNVLMRTSYQEAGVTAENAYKENGAFWSTMSYLWGWDVDRINATYSTTNPATGLNDKQVNVTALQPNKPQYPPLKAGDRFPINWTGATGATVAGYPSINISGIRPGGVDYSHATDSLNTGGDSVTTPVNVAYATGNGNPSNPFYVDDISFFTVGGSINVDKGKPVRTITAITPDPGNPPKGWIETNGEVPYGTVNTAGNITVATVTGGSTANVNVVGKDAVNMGWEFDDLPISLEVTGTNTLPDGTTVPSGYKVVYDIPPTHPQYNSLKVLNGTEPKILDAPTSLVKDRINNPGFDYTGSVFVNATNTAQYHKAISGYSNTASGAGCHNPGGCEVTAEHDPPQIFNNQLVGTFEITSCSPASIVPGVTKVSLKYRFRVHQNQGKWGSTSPGDDGLSGTNIPDHDFTTHDWNNQGAVGNNFVGIGWSPGDPPYWQVPMPAFEQLVNVDLTGGAPYFLLDSAPAPNSSPTDAFITTGTENVKIRMVQGGASNIVRFEVYFTGDLNDLEMEVKDVEIVSYAGNDRSSWNASTGPGALDNGGAKYNAGDVEPVVMVGDPTVNISNSPDEVVNKYYPSIYQFTQFNDQYNNAYNPSDANDVLRSPWEFGLLNIGTNAAGTVTSKLSGELSVDLNGRRLNLDGDKLSSEVNWDQTTAAVSSTGFSLTTAGLGVQNAYSFAPYVAPTDDCSTGHVQTFMDADPLTTDRTHLKDDEVLSGEAPITPTSAIADPMRTADPAWTQAGYYDFAGNPVSIPNPTQFKPNAATDTTGTVDRIAASDNNLQYTVSIPTNDVNVLRKENNLLFNLGKMDGADYGLDIENPFMEYRTAPGYTTVPRYRVDPGGNIFDTFGKGFYDPLNPKDADSLSRLYTKSNGAVLNGQVSNDDHAISTYTTTYAAAGTFESYIQNHDRLAMANDDYNFFDYVPDLALDPNSAEGARKNDLYIGSFPSNFYYYREQLDNSLGELGTPATGDIAGTPNFNSDNRPALNFDGSRSNLTGAYASAHTNVYNTDTPSFANVTMGYTQQDAKLSNATSPLTNVIWQGFPGLGTENSYAQQLVTSTNVTNPLNALGNGTAGATMNFSTSSITLGMGKPVNPGGYLVINEVDASGNLTPHVVPLPLLERTGPFPSFDNAGDPSAESYTFKAYGAETVTRTGSQFKSFQTILDGVDGTFGDGMAGGVAAAMSKLTAAGGVFASADPAGTPDTWPAGVMLHVDGAANFDMTYPRNKVTLGTDAATVYRVVYKDVTSSPQTLYLIRDDGANLGGDTTGTLGTATTIPGFVHADLQVRAITGQFTVNVTDPAGTPDINGSNVKIDYDDLGTQQSVKIASVAIAGDKDRVGRIAGDDPRTSTVETDFIGPEVFASPRGYVQPDAQLALNLVSQDKDGNPKARKLKAVHVSVQSGEQIIPTKLRQDYSTDGPFGYTDWTSTTPTEWPIALFDENTQINPQTTGDIGYFVGLYQGITASNATAAVPTVDVTSVFGYSLGQTVTINGEQRKITNIAGNTLTLDKPLTNNAKLGDRVSVGSTSDGSQELQMFLNRSFAMSMGAGVKVTLDYDEYDITGYPPVVNPGTATAVTETIGFSDNSPSSVMQIAPTNAGTTTITVNSTAGFANGETVNVNGSTRTIMGLTPTTVTLDLPVQHDIGQPYTSGTISHVDYENFLVAGTGRTGGAADNEFTQELKRIVDNPEYKELFRHNLFKDIFITASINDPFNDLVASKLFLNWDRIRKEVEIKQSSFTAYFKS